MPNWFAAATPEDQARLLAAWPGAPIENVDLAGMLLDVAREQVLAYAPDYEETAEPGTATYALASDEDQPVVTTLAADHWANATLIPGSDGWVRERRAGAAETAVGVAQASSTAALDLTGSTRFRYYGAPSVPANPGNGNFVSTDLLPGGTPQSAFWPLTVDFVTSSPTVDFRINAVNTGGEFGRIYVNGQPISDRSTLLSSPPNAGADAVVRLTFPDAARRRIQVFGLNYRGRWGGVAVEGGFTVAKPPAPKRTIAFIGDSHTRGAGSGAETVRPGETFIHAVTLAMGGDAIVNAGIGGTGFIAQNGGGATAVYAGRVADVLAMAPDVLIVSGGANDTADITAAATSLLNNVRGVPEVYVFSTARQALVARRNELQAAALATGTRYLNTVDLTGLPTISDGVHLTPAGHQMLADQIAAALTVTAGAPDRLVYAQLQQAKTLWSAGMADENGNVGTEGYSFIPRPLDKTIRSIIRPTSGVADVF